MTERDADAVKTLPEQLDELRAEMKHEREQRQKLENSLDGYGITFKYVLGAINHVDIVQQTVIRHNLQIDALLHRMDDHKESIKLFQDNFSSIANSIRAQTEILTRLCVQLTPTAPVPDSKTPEASNTIVHSNPPPW